MLPSMIIGRLKKQVKRVKILHEKDKKRGYGKTLLPKALDKKYPGAAKRLAWQYLFPS